MSLRARVRRSSRSLLAATMALALPAAASADEELIRPAERSVQAAFPVELNDVELAGVRGRDLPATRPSSQRKRVVLWDEASRSVLALPPAAIADPNSRVDIQSQSWSPAGLR